MTINSNVVPLAPGYSVPSQEAVAEVVSILEDALDEAKSGQMIAVAVVAVQRKPVGHSFTYHSEQGGRENLFTGVMGLNWALGKLAAKDED